MKNSTFKLFAQTLPSEQKKSLLNLEYNVDKLLELKRLILKTMSKKEEDFLRILSENRTKTNLRILRS